MDYGVETIKRQTRAAYSSLDTGQSPRERAWTARAIGCTPARCVRQSPAAAALYGLWHYIVLIYSIFLPLGRWTCD